VAQVSRNELIDMAVREAMEPIEIARARIQWLAHRAVPMSLLSDVHRRVTDEWRHTLRMHGIYV
jgi:hypothetical protein